jgi:hypothetical protein
MNCCFSLFSQMTRCAENFKIFICEFFFLIIWHFRAIQTMHFFQYFVTFLHQNQLKVTIIIPCQAKTKHRNFLPDKFDIWVSKNLYTKFHENLRCGMSLSVFILDSLYKKIQLRLILMILGHWNSNCLPIFCASACDIILEKAVDETYVHINAWVTTVRKQLILNDLRIWQGVL